MITIAYRVDKGKQAYFTKKYLPFELTRSSAIILLKEPKTYDDRNHPDNEFPGYRADRYDNGHEGDVALDEGAFFFL